MSKRMSVHKGPLICQQSWLCLRFSIIVRVILTPHPVLHNQKISLGKCPTTGTHNFTPCNVTKKSRGKFIREEAFKRVNMVNH
ncbi:hypothetical protein HOLleu_28885 [Holothuria leucospilota]|uniref:Uncharacterized protein n=1 Tax=Holothuria leucospilota TaxID=206669 RepID=A0A9Q1BMU6_HOLLE|nr:hypothetical protein HOLleu_28885 [Holothuria leucospilota]